MKEQLEKMLTRHDEAMFEYLDMNKRLVFGALIQGQEMASGIANELAHSHSKRKVLLDAINALEILEPMKEPS